MSIEGCVHCEIGFNIPLLKCNPAVVLNDRRLIKYGRARIVCVVVSI